MAKERKKPSAKKPKPVQLPAPVEKKEQSLSLSSPTDILEFGKILQSYISSNKLSVKIADKDYPLAGAWKFAGLNFGLSADPVELKAEHQKGEYVTTLYAKQKIEGTRRDGSRYEYEKEYVVFVGFTKDTEIIDSIRSRVSITREITRPYYSYRCIVDVTRMSDGKLVGKGESVCSNLETLKAGFEEHAVMGQAQTRTIARSLKNKLDFVLQAAGFEGTPAEEMTGSEDELPFDREEKSTPPKTKVAKAKPSEKLFGELVERAKKGEKILAIYGEHLEFTDEQKEVLKALEPKEHGENSETKN